MKKRTYTVIIPDNIDGFINCDEFVYYADRKGLVAIMMSALLMLKDKNVIVYFTLWHNSLQKYYLRGSKESYDISRVIYDVVFVHHAVQLPISDWKQIRMTLPRLKSERCTYKADVEKEYEAYMKMYEMYTSTDKYYKRLDTFSIKERFDTYFCVGSRAWVLVTGKKDGR
ncbi:MAG: hypothetical protein IJ391_02445 [Clostridia bacterium]|nr:hypothetical protein [Clostridia bacterium]